MTVEADLVRVAERFLAAWNSQDVEAVVACYSAGVTYRDPNTRGEVIGADAMRRYLRKLFAAWQMHWTLKEVHAFADGTGAAVLWHASFRMTGQEQSVEAEGMDLVIMDGDRIKRNEVYFDRAALAPLMR
ncbi:MAG: nuclear transport factor 2 family protein [Acidobacteriota bacterium]